MPQPRDSSRRDAAALLDILKAAQSVLDFAQGLGQTELQQDILRQSAILYQVMIIGEATKRLSPEFRQQHSDVPWSQIAGMRDIVAHQYDRVEFDVVWQAIEQEIPELINVISGLIDIQGEP